jgi:hypothetical protein
LTDQLQGNMPDGIALVGTVDSVGACC